MRKLLVWVSWHSHCLVHKGSILAVCIATFYTGYKYKYAELIAIRLLLFYCAVVFISIRIN